MVREATIISDRDKGRLQVEAVLGPEMVVAWCCNHMMVNFTEKFGRGWKDAFWTIPRAQTEEDICGELEKLRGDKVEAADWLELPLLKSGVLGAFLVAATATTQATLLRA